IQAGRGARRRSLEIALPGRVAAPVADIAAVGARTTDRVRGNADSYHLLHLAAGDTDELHAVAAGGRYPDSIRRIEGETGGMRRAPDTGLVQHDRLAPGVPAIVLTDGLAQVVLGVGHEDMLVAGQQADDAEADRGNQRLLDLAGRPVN